MDTQVMYTEDKTMQRLSPIFSQQLNPLNQIFGSHHFWPKCALEVGDEKVLRNGSTRAS